MKKKSIDVSTPDDTFLLRYVVTTTTHPLSKSKLTTPPKGKKLSQTDAIGELDFFFHVLPRTASKQGARLLTNSGRHTF